MRTATAGGTHDIGAGEISEYTAAGGRDTRKATSVAADEVGAGGRHGARPGVRGRISGRLENPAGKSSVVGGEEGGREASGVACESSGVEGKEGGREASGVAENPGGGRQGVRGGVQSPQGIDAPIVEALPGGIKTPEWTPRATE